MIRLGIDLGTTNSVAASQSRVLPLLSEGGTLLPSVVALPPSGTVMVGGKAKRRRKIDPRNTIFSSKRLIGRRWTSEDTRSFREKYPLSITRAADGSAAFDTRGGVVSPTEIAGAIIAELLRQAAPDPGRISAVLAVPVAFTEAHREATREAAMLAGLAEVILIEEPHAVALAFVHHSQKRPRYVAAYDFGGGTFDVAILDCAEHPFRTLASGGDLLLGGDEIDLALAATVAEEVLRTHRWDLATDRNVFARLVAECEQAKIRLCRSRETQIDLAQVDPAFPANTSRLRVDYRRLATVTLRILQRSFLICDRVLCDSGLQAHQIDMVALAGGVTLLPMIRKGVASYFGKRPQCHLNPLEVVGVGASLAPT